MTMDNMTNFRIIIEQLHPNIANYFIISDQKIYPNSVKMDSEDWWIVVQGEGSSLTIAFAFAEEMLRKIKGE